MICFKIKLCFQQYRTFLLYSYFIDYKFWVDFSLACTRLSFCLFLFSFLYTHLHIRRHFDSLVCVLDITNLYMYHLQVNCLNH